MVSPYICDFWIYTTERITDLYLPHRYSDRGLKGTFVNRTCHSANGMKLGLQSTLTFGKLLGGKYLGFPGNTVIVPFPATYFINRF